VPAVDAEVSIVSIDSSNKPAWVTFAVPFQLLVEGGEDFIEAGTPIYVLHSTNMGLRFDVQALGQPQVVNALLNAKTTNDEVCGAQPAETRWCVSPQITHSQIFRTFYRRKASGTLDSFTLKEGVDLAQAFVQATLQTSLPSWGVGGPIDVLTLTQHGTTWKVQKHEQEFPPAFHEYRRQISMANGNELLDGLQCLLCRFENMTLRYEGLAPVELVRPKFEGKCELLLGNNARKQRPIDVQYLEQLVAGHCSVRESTQ
jgi:hypothetical protein